MAGQWDWVSFIVGVVVGLVVMWVAAVVAQMGDADKEEHFR